MSVKHKVVGKKKSDKDKRNCVAVTEQETSVGLHAPKRKDFCCMLCDKYVDKYDKPKRLHYGALYYTNNNYSFGICFLSVVKHF